MYPAISLGVIPNKMRVISPILEMFAMMGKNSGGDNVSNEGEWLRLVVVEDEDLFRQLLRISLDHHPRLTVLADFRTGEEAIEWITCHGADAVLLDIDLGRGLNGVATGIRLKEYNAKLGIVLLSNHADPEILRVLPESEAGGWAYLLKKSARDINTVVRAIEGTVSGLLVVDPSLTHQLASINPLQQLTPRQQGILRLIAEGYTNYEIAKQLFLSEKSIENQVGIIYHTLQIDTSGRVEHPRVRATLAFLQMSGSRFVTEGNQ